MTYEIVKIISRHKKNKDSPNQRGLWHCKIGLAQCIVLKDGVMVTRHIAVDK